MNCLDDFVEMLWDQAYWIGYHDGADDVEPDDEAIQLLIHEWMEMLEHYMENKS